MMRTTVALLAMGLLTVAAAEHADARRVPPECKGAGDPAPPPVHELNLAAQERRLEQIKQMKSALERVGPRARAEILYRMATTYWTCYQVEQYLVKRGLLRGRPAMGASYRTEAVRLFKELFESHRKYPLYDRVIYFRAAALRHSDPELATKLVMTLIRRYPRGLYWGHAQYFLGELLLSRGDHGGASNAFLLARRAKDPRVRSCAREYGRMLSGK